MPFVDLRCRSYGYLPVFTQSNVTRCALLGVHYVSPVLLHLSPQAVALLV